MPEKVEQRGRPPFAPTAEQRKQAQTLAGLGLRQQDIALVIGVSEVTLRKYFSEELTAGTVVANAKVAETLFKMATDEAHPKAAICAMFWLKCRAKWREQDDGGKKAADAETAKTVEQGTSWEAVLN